MPTTNKEIKCPICEKTLPLQEHPQFKPRLVAYCNCRPGLGIVEVYSTDNPAYKPVKESDSK